MYREMNGFEMFNIGEVWEYANSEVIRKSFQVSPSCRNTEQHEAAMIKPNVIVAPYMRIKINFDFPLNAPACLEFESDSLEGFSRLDFYRAIVDGYKHIYEAENSENPYGVWGHPIGDLFVENVLQIKRAEYKLFVGGG
jgi:hypothetical protein